MINDKIIVALDTQSPKELEALITEIKNEATYVKVGMELYYSFGKDIIRELKDHNLKVFLDLKMHDIPSTVYKATKALASIGVDMLNVHASGGKLMMKAAKEGLKEVNSNAKLIAVTQLTSTDQKIMNEQLLISGDINQAILSYAILTKDAGLDGVVCSAHEVRSLKEKLGEDFLCITPGIRPKGSFKNDQKRVMTPLEAINAGSDYMVIGRAISQAKSPKDAYKSILREIS